MPSSAAHKFHRQWPRLFHPFAAFWRKNEIWDKKISIQLMPCSLKWIKFCNFRIFWNWGFLLEVYESCGFRVIISIRWPYQTFPFIDKNGRFDVGRNFQGFLLFCKISIFHQSTIFTKQKKKKKKNPQKPPKKQSIDFCWMTTGSKLEQSVLSTLFKNWQIIGNCVALSIESNWP